MHVALLPVSRWLDRRSFRRSPKVYPCYRLDVPAHLNSEPDVRARCLADLRRDDRLRLLSIQSSEALEAQHDGRRIGN